MWNRACPLCFARVSRYLVLSHSNDLTCPACHAALELSQPSRLLASSFGLLAALLIFHVHLPHTGANWVLRLAASFLAFGLASAILLFFAADLVVRPNDAPSSFPHAGA